MPAYPASKACDCLARRRPTPWPSPRFSPGCARPAYPRHDRRAAGVRWQRPERQATVKPAAFTYHRPATVDQAVDLLAELAPQDGRVLAGGQSLVPIMAFRLARPAHLIDINRVAGLDGLSMRDGQLRIGARVRHAAFHRPVEDGPLGALLATVVRHIAHYPIRLRGTFCGSLAHADPAAEWCLVAATLDAELVAVSRRGERILSAHDFFHGAMQTALQPDELLVEARLPLLPPDARF